MPLKPIDESLGEIAEYLVTNGITKDEAIDQFERKYVLAALIFAKGNMTKAARRGGVHRNTLINRCRALMIETPRETRRRLRRRR